MAKIGGVGTCHQNDPKNRPKIGFPGGPPGKVLILKKSAAILGGFFGFFPEKSGFWGGVGGWGGVPVIKEEQALHLR